MPSLETIFIFHIASRTSKISLDNTQPWASTSREQACNPVITSFTRGLMNGKCVKQHPVQCLLKFSVNKILHSV